jgi:signal transduction histidine kinase
VTFTTSTAGKLLSRYERIVEISQQLTSTLDHAALLRRIISAATELTDCEEASILLLDPTTGELRFEQASNMSSTDFDGFVIPIEGSIAGWVVTHGEARVIEDVTQEPSFFPNVDEALEFRTRNLLAVPMRAHQKVIGCLEAVNKRNGERFNGDDIRLLSILAGQAAIAIENARLFQQKDFMSEMVHELRTPLAALKTSIALLLRPDLPENRKGDIIFTLQSETDRLIRLTTDYLDLARLESGRAKIDIVRLNMRDLLVECLDIVAPQAAERHIVVELHADDIEAAGDRGKLKQVILNLLTNAIKYNREGGRITASISQISRRDGELCLVTITDTGYGISKENQKQMFQKFYRAADTSGFTQGTGLGLAVAKRIIESHGGAIWLESEINVGSSFYVTLPLAD